MLFYYVQKKDRHDPGVNIREKPSIASVNKDRGSRVGGKGGRGECSETLSRDFRGQNALRTLLGPKRHLD